MLSVTYAMLHITDAVFYIPHWSPRATESVAKEIFLIFSEDRTQRNLRHPSLSISCLSVVSTLTPKTQTQSKALVRHPSPAYPSLHPAFPLKSSPNSPWLASTCLLLHVSHDALIPSYASPPSPHLGRCYYCAPCVSPNPHAFTWASLWCQLPADSSLQPSGQKRAPSLRVSRTTCLFPF